MTSNLVSSRFEVDVPALASESALEPDEKGLGSLAGFSLVLAPSGEHLTDLIVVTRVTELVHALAHQVHLELNNNCM